MARGLNKVMLIGNVGQDAELSFLPSGHSMAKFSVATSRAWKDKQGAAQKKTQWHNIVAWGKLAEICDKYVKKGGQVYVEGRLTTRKYQSKDGVEKLAVEIVAEQMQLLGGKPGGAGREAAAGSGQTGNARASAMDDVAGAEESFSHTEITDDDIPF